VLEKLGSVKDEVRIGILPDHPTPVKIRAHVSDPVPFLIYDPNVSGDSVSEFDEASCKDGSFGLLEKDGFIRELFKK
jgi:2,3-bisphosphoglycerate-independent phosphoglycerate mutase